MSVTPDVSRKVGIGIAPSPSPFYTPRPHKRRSDYFNSTTKRSNSQVNGEVNVQVVLRCRPLSEVNLPKAVSCDELRREVTVAAKQIDRLFTFDKVFGPKSQQRSIYDQAIAPIVSEVLDGFNCTVFAYGQTGTGKTYTMEGGIRNKGGEVGAEAGVIPRAVRQIFDTLESQNADYSVKVTFSELYNEEIIDLLCNNNNNEDDFSKRLPVSLMEDAKGCVLVRGLKEETVYSVNEIYSLLERGSAKRRTSDTLLNKRSSRSHSIFSITVHIKESGFGEEELIKCGKLNLVDLAGSENISRSGARESRAREAGEINKSLLTLGRVINALVEHSSHVPYRDSKLTRLLRDSLGGKTKTCIIATISPSALCLEETLSTLDYAYRAKNIRNKPEANQKMAKSVLLKDLYLELERMKEDVRAAREKNGVYVPQERFAQDEEEKKAKNEKIQILENNLVLAEKEVDRFRELYLTEQEQKLDLQSDLKDCKMSLGASNKALLDLQENYQIAIASIKEKESVISNLLSSENSLIECAKGLRNDLQFASEDISSLLTRLDEKEKKETTNQNLVMKFGSQLDQSLKDLHKAVIGSVSQQTQQICCMEENLCANLARKNDLTQALELRVDKMRETYKSGVEGLKELSSLLERKASSELNQINATLSSRATFVENFISSVVTDANEVICDIQNYVNEQRQILDFYTNQQEEAIKRSLVAAKIISSATTRFFTEVHDRASQVDRLLEENQHERCQQINSMEMAFKEECLREEREAVKKISAILSNVTAKRIATVSEASRKMLESNEEEKNRLAQEMREIRHITLGATKEMSSFLDATENDCIGNTFSVAQHRTFTDDCINKCAERVESSKQQWGNVQSSMKNVNDKTLAEIQSTIEENISTNKEKLEEFILDSMNVDSEFNAAASKTLATIKDSAKEEKENKEEMENLSRLCLEELSERQEEHGKRVAKMRNEAENCIRKDYIMTESEAPKARHKNALAVPSLASIEEMRSDGRSRIKTAPIRTPFTDVLNNQLNQ